MQRIFQPCQALAKLIEKVKEFVWGEEQATTWDELKRRLILTQTQEYLDQKKTFILDTEASGAGIAVVLSQEKKRKLETDSV